MFPRLDLVSVQCPECRGSGKSPRNRKRPCIRCSGDKVISKCKSCGCLMPCPGTDEGVFDQTYCSLPDKKASSALVVKADSVENIDQEV